MDNDTTNDRRFGVGASIVSEGHYVVGSDPTAALDQNVYNFRQRGPAWSAVDVSVTPASLETAKLGLSIDIDGGTAVVGAKDYDGRGAAFVFVQNESTGTWSLQATLEAPGASLGAAFGSSVAVL